MNRVFTYGSLMFDEVWSRVVGRGCIPTAASLAGFRRHRVRGEDYPGLVRVDQGAAEGAGVGGGESVDGVLYLEVQAADLLALDEFEGPDYRRIQVPVTVSQQVVNGPPKGSVLLADTYLFVAAAKVDPAAWDPVEFEHRRMARFLHRYVPAKG